MRTLLQDLKYGLRMLARSPGFTAVAVLSLALGIGANTAIFTLINAVLVKSLPVEKPEELVLLGEGRASGMAVIQGIPQAGPWELVSYPLYREYRDQSQVFTSVCAFQSNENRLSVRVSGASSAEPPEQANGKVVSGNYFSVLGVKAALGRTLAPEDDSAKGAHPVAVISDGYWQRRFSRDPSVVGRVMEINGAPLTVVGVTPPGFFGETLETDPTDIWMPITMQPRVMMRPSILQRRDAYWLDVIGRLKPGITPRQAQAAVTLHFQQYLAQVAGSSLSVEDRRELLGVRIDITPGGKGISQLRRRFSAPLRVLMALVGLVLLIACANVANLLLARASTRQKEISVRLVLGASRAQVIRQLLTESLLLAILGGAAGLLFAAWGSSLLVSLVSHGASLPLSVKPDAPVLGFTLVVSLLTGVLFGLAPAVRATRIDLTPALKEGARSVLGHGSRFGLAKALVVLQVALSLLLLVGAGLFVRSLRNLESQDLGFSPERVLVVGIDPRIAGYKPAQLPSLYRLLQERVEAIPGVRSASLAAYGLESGSRQVETINVQGYTPNPRERMVAQVTTVGPRYFETVGMTLAAGRGIGPQDTETSAKVAVINETMARYYYGRENPIGKRFGFGPPAHGADLEVVGVTRDARYNGLREETPQMVYLPAFQNPEYLRELEVRTVGNPTSVAQDVRHALTAIDSKLPVVRITTLSERVGGSLNQERLIAQLSSFFGALALLLACVGLYGIMSYAVVRRTSEIGIRMALGAQRGNIIGMVLRETMLLVLIGVAIGVPAALATTRLASSVISGLLFGLKATDPVTISVATLVMVAVAAFAGFLPARRASRVDPMVALRYE